ncbi:MAG: recombination protein NinG [Lutibacter sp.]|jgi:hypothetical protein
MTLKVDTYRLCACGCGREVYQNRNSTIKNKLHPNCQLKAVYSKKKKSDPKDSFFTGKSKKKSNKFDFYKTDAWKYFSRYVKTFYADNDGNMFCSTCNKPIIAATKDCQAGHYIKVMDMSKTNYSVALEFTNVLPQCYQCNKHGGGRQDIMRTKLVKLFGESALNDLDIKKNNSCKLDPVVLEYYANYYKEKLNNLLKERDIKDFWKSK